MNETVLELIVWVMVMGFFVASFALVELLDRI